MRININQRDLQKHIAIAQRAVSSRNTMQILEGIQFSAKDGNLTLTSTDFELSVVTNVKCSVEREGVVVINSSYIGNIVRKLPDSSILIDVKENNIYIQCENSEFNLVGYDVSEFPTLPEVEGEHTVVLDDRTLKQCIKHTLFSVSTDEMRPNLMGVLVDIHHEDTTFVSLDGYRLSRVIVHKENDTEKSVIIPNRTLNEVSKIIEEGTDITIQSVPSHVLFDFGHTVLYSRLIGGDFLKYNSVLNDDYVTEVVVDRLVFLSALERASLLAKEDKANLIKISIAESVMEITSNTEIGNVHEVIHIQREGEELKIAFNSKYLIEGVKIMESEKLILHFSGRLNPCIIKPMDDDLDYTYLVLPVRLANEQY